MSHTPRCRSVVCASPRDLPFACPHSRARRPTGTPTHPTPTDPRQPRPPGGAADRHAPGALPARDLHHPLLRHRAPDHPAAQRAAGCARGRQGCRCRPLRHALHSRQVHAQQLPLRNIAHPHLCNTVHPPAGSTLFLEVKHWKSDKRRFSTLAWSAVPLDRLVDFSPQAARVSARSRLSSRSVTGGEAGGRQDGACGWAPPLSPPSSACPRGWPRPLLAHLPDLAQVRSGPVDLPLFKKPVDLTLRRAKRLTSRAFDLHLSIRGIE